MGPSACLEESTLRRWCEYHDAQLAVPFVVPDHVRGAIVMAHPGPRHVSVEMHFIKLAQEGVGETWRGKALCAMSHAAPTQAAEGIDWLPFEPGVEVPWACAVCVAEYERRQTTGKTS